MKKVYNVNSIKKMKIWTHSPEFQPTSLTISFPRFWSYCLYFISENVGVQALKKVQNFKIYIDFKAQKQEDFPYIIYKEN